ncbi:MAG: hypothetical protein ACK4WD_02590 [Flavobacteriales bacterium]|jgi:hypothetical protein
MGTHKLLLALFTLTLLFAACNSSQDLNTGVRYEDDEVYYQPGEAFITDASVSSSNDNSVPNNSQNTTPSTVEEEDYYSGDTQQGDIVNNYYGDVNQNWGNGGFNNGWGGNGFNNGWGGNSRFYYDPIWGWRLGFGVGNGWNNGWNTGWNAGWNNGWNAGFNTGFYDPWYDPWNNPWCNSFGWNQPFYDPWAWNGFNNGWNNGWNTGWNNGWNNPWNNPWNNGFGWNGGFYNPWVWAGNTNENGVVIGQRPSISGNSAIGSSIISGTSPRRTRSKEFYLNQQGQTTDSNSGLAPRPTTGTKTNPDQRPFVDPPKTDPRVGDTGAPGGVVTERPFRETAPNRNESGGNNERPMVSPRESAPPQRERESSPNVAPQRERERPSVTPQRDTQPSRDRSESRPEVRPQRTEPSRPAIERSSPPPSRPSQSGGGGGRSGGGGGNSGGTRRR